MNSVVTAIAEIDRGGRYDAARRWPLSGHVCAAPRRGSRPGRAELRSPSPDCHEVAWSGALQAPLGVAADLPFAHAIYGKACLPSLQKGRTTYGIRAAHCINRGWRIRAAARRSKTRLARLIGIRSDGSGDRCAFSRENSVPPCACKANSIPDRSKRRAELAPAPSASSDGAHAAAMD